jgi:hypothetical protein
MSGTCLIQHHPFAGEAGFPFARCFKLVWLDHELNL